MALNIVEQQQIINGVILPPSNMVIQDLVLQAAFKYSFTFRENIKDTTGNEPATNYLNNIQESIDSIFKLKSTLSGQPKTPIILSRIIIMLLGETATTYAGVQAADDAAWATFITNHIEEAFDIISHTLSTEKAAYDAII